MIAEVSRRFSFRAVHALAGRERHDDSFVLTLTVRGPMKNGIVIDFDKLAAAADLVVVRLHGADVTAKLGLRSTEEIAVWIWREVSIWLPALVQVELDDGTCAIRFRGEVA